MTLLFENALAVAVGGGLLIVFTLLVWFAQRNLASQVALAGAIGVTALLLAVERYVQTDREQVESGVYAVLEAVEANDLASVLQWIDPSAANVIADAKRLMPTIEIKKSALISDVAVDVAQGTPPTTSSEFRCFVQGIQRNSPAVVGAVSMRVEVEWVKRDDRWLIDGYRLFDDNGNVIDAVRSAERRQTVPVS